MSQHAAAARTIAEIDWKTWSPVDPATLVFVRRDHEILLIRKKRGLGAGKINGPGGRTEPGESPEACAIREAEEELGITPTGVALAGENSFQFIDGYSIHVHIFTADGFTGEPVETDEAIPLWTPVGAIPYDEMWEDDFLWVPHMLDGTRFLGRFIFDGEKMLDHVIELG
ncbi:MAG: 8-oxo-dGTP diphosphatase [Planctomycetota bacterium]